MNGFGVTIRLLDPPLHEFVPHEEVNQREMARELGMSLDEIRAKVEALSEMNPMLGHRGCRLGVTYPEITEMQARAIFEAACKLKKEFRCEARGYGAACRVCFRVEDAEGNHCVDRGKGNAGNRHKS